ncbi:YihY/virulence factor BrkB family protein [Novosphingobium sp. KACC 22771]|uniref:YihY/virulence factor BrkB family protein n=1 Tax=Novosphingobium sp. KACC 22771 TaxID=3025670 RepID=UPI002365B547|nr:YihY/virulence factor BrkB family protein [Novosphingobium sp. KACC 22771]WDF75095.1 YihY/virulence factor BrkB family protein [Novosphingobium sp. KACC 22771]
MTAQAHIATPGADANSPLEMPWAAWRQIIVRVWKTMGEHQLNLLAAGVSFYTFLAFVPIIASLVLVYGLVGDPQAIASGLDELRGFLPDDVMRVARPPLLAAINAETPAKGLGLIMALGVALYGAMNAAFSLLSAMNLIYEEAVKRSFFRTLLLALTVTSGMVALGVLATAAIALVSWAGPLLTVWWGEQVLILARISVWSVAVVVVSVGFAVLYRMVPDRQPAKWRWLALGAFVSTVMWMGLTLGFGVYVDHIASYNAVYGSLATVVVFQMWLYLSAYAALIGAAVNCEIERQTMVDTTVGPDLPIGQRGAALADKSGKAGRGAT